MPTLLGAARGINDSLPAMMMTLLRWLVPFASAFFVTVLLGPWAARVGRRLKALDQPERRKHHAGAMARSGGLALGAGLLIGAWAGAPLAGIFDRAELQRLGGLTLAAAAIYLVGFLDDVMDLPPRHKFAGQLVAPTFLAMMGLGVGEHHPAAVAVPLTFLVVLAAVNALNFLDGMDGLAAGVTIAAALALAAVLGTAGSPLPAAWALALAGAAAGFLVHNFHPAALFMGDGGAFLCGFALAFSSLEILDRSFTPTTLGLLLLFLAVPVVDTALAVGRRLLGRRPVTMADRRHTYHLLYRAGWSQRRIFFAFTAATILLSTGGLWVSGARRAVLWYAGGCTLAFLLVCAARFFVRGMPAARGASAEGTSS